MIYNIISQQSYSVYEITEFEKNYDYVFCTSKGEVIALLDNDQYKINKNCNIISWLTLVFSSNIQVINQTNPYLLSLNFSKITEDILSSSINEFHSIYNVKTIKDILKQSIPSLFGIDFNIVDSIPNGLIVPEFYNIDIKNPYILRVM